MINTVWQITLRELKRIVTLPSHYIVLLLLPPLLFFFYAYLYINPKVENLPMAIWDEDHSPISREFTFMLEQTESIHFSEAVNNLEELKKLIQDGTVMGAVHFPKRMESDIKSRQPVQVTVYANSAMLIPGKMIYKDAAKVIITAGSGVILQKLVKTGMPQQKAMSLVQPIELSTYSLYNPQLDYQQYLVPGLITVALQMIIIMVSLLIINFEHKTGTWNNLVNIARGSASCIIAGKTLAHLAIAWVNFILMVGVIFPYFGIGVDAATGKLFLLFSLLALACIGIGQMISVIFSDPVLSCDIGLFYTSPAFVFSGFTFPRWAMPWYDQYYAQIMPYTAFLSGYFKIYSMNLPLAYALREISILLAFIAVTYWTSTFLLQVRIRKEVALVA